jgi:hypothetical protein
LAAVGFAMAGFAAAGLAAVLVAVVRVAGLVAIFTPISHQYKQYISFQMRRNARE